MKRRLLQVGLGLLVVGLAGWGWYHSRPREPEYQGKTVTQWIKEYGAAAALTNRAPSTTPLVATAVWNIQFADQNGRTNAIRMEQTADTNNLATLLNNLRRTGPVTVSTNWISSVP
jgi:hypothetical protein